MLKHLALGVILWMIRNLLKRLGEHRLSAPLLSLPIQRVVSKGRTGLPKKRGNETIYREKCFVIAKLSARRISFVPVKLRELSAPCCVTPRQQAAIKCDKAPFFRGFCRTILLDNQSGHLQYFVTKHPLLRGFVTGYNMQLTRSLSTQESRVVLALTERRQRDTTRAEIVELLGSSAKAADHVIESLRRKGWLQRATWGEYLLVPPELGPDALGDSNLLALASRVADPYYIGFASAASYYGLTTQYRNVIFVVTPVRVRAREIGESRVRIVNPSKSKFFGFSAVDVLGYQVMMSDREKTAIDCIDRPNLAGGVGEVALILATASRRFDWNKVASYLERIGAGSIARRFGWLSDHVKADMPPDIRNRILSVAAKSRKTWLGSDQTRARAVKGAIAYDETWRVFVNVPREELHGSAGLGQRKQIRKGA